MSDARSYVRQHVSRFIEELEELLRIPSISTEPGYEEDVARAAGSVAEGLRAAGMRKVVLERTEGNPIVVGTHIEDEDAPTLLVYGHYDVQSVDPVDEWTSPPFEPTEREGRLYARGAIDDKGQVHMHVKAIEARLMSGAGLPVNVKVVVEGEEEVGSANLERFLRANAERLGCDAVVISDTGMLSREQPSITVGLRGISYHEIHVRGPATDLHSGTYGGAVVNPALALAGMLTALKDADGRVTVPGFYDRVRPLTPEQRAAIAALPFSEEEFRRETGVPALGGEVGYSSLERIGMRPCLDVNGLISGFTGEGSKTVLPARARAKVSMRLVPDQDPEEVAERFTSHVRDLAPEGVEVEVRFSHAGRPWAADPEGAVFEAAAAALETGFGKAPVFLRDGGSIPIVPLFEEVFGAPVLLLGFGLPGSNLHAPDEWIDLEVYGRGIETLVALYDEVASRGL